jgi:thiol-disulfide isomerase/thioredoxin
MMKKLLLILLSIIVISCNDNKEKVRITGKVNNPISNEISVHYITDFLNYETEKILGELDENNSFSVKMPLEKSKMVFLSIGDLDINLYLNPKTKVNVELDAQNIDKKPVISGENAYESIFLVDYVHDIGKKLSMREVFGAAGKMEFDEAILYLNEVKTNKLDYLLSYERLNILEKEFVSYFTNKFYYDYYSNLIILPGYYQYLNKLSALPELPGDYYDFLLVENIFDESLINLPDYLSFLTNYLEYKMSSSPYNKEVMGYYYKYQIELAKEIFTGKNLDYIIAKTVNTALLYSDFTESEPLYTEYIDSINSEKFRAIVKSQYEKIQSLMPGNPAPDFTLTDIDGNVITLKDFEGKVIYLDFWASWCGPCIREFPFAKELKKRMSDNENLVFLYVSIDSDIGKWKEAIEKFEIQGIHVNSNENKGSMPDTYNVQGVPEYYIIGKDGKIFDNMPPRPSNSKIDEALLNALDS